MKTLNILCIGDIIGRPGRICLEKHLSSIQKSHQIDFTIANAENAAGGFGLTIKTYKELLTYKIDALTSGNHIFHQKDIISDFDNLNKLIRPLNYPKGVPGKGYRLLKYNNYKIAVINLIGRVFMGEYDCPFQTIEKTLKEIQKETPIILIDFHAEATSEKNAMGWFLDDKVSLVFGTHTHIMTNDEQILPNGTGYITDIGMVGPYDSVIGMKKSLLSKNSKLKCPPVLQFQKPQKLSLTLLNAKLTQQQAKPYP